MHALSLTGAAHWRSVGRGGLEGIGVELQAINGVERRAAAKGWPEHAPREDAATTGHWDGTHAWERTVLSDAQELGALVSTEAVWHLAVAVGASERSEATARAEHWELGLATETSLSVWHAVVIV